MPPEGASSSFVATGTTDNQVAILTFPALEVVVPPFGVEGGDLVDLDWGGPQGTWLSIATQTKLSIYAFAGGKLNLVQAITVPNIDDGPVAFRAVRFAPESPASPALLAALNSTALPRREARKKTRKAYVAKYETAASAGEKDGQKESEKEVEDEKADPVAAPPMTWRLANKREVANKPITVFDVSPNGRLVSFGSSDLSIGMLDAHTLAPLLKILQAHSFPPTALKFNPSATMLVSASADNTIRTVIVPSSFGASGESHYILATLTPVPSTMVIVLLALLVFMVAVLLRK